MDLTEFITARLAEDEAAAKAALLGFEPEPGREPELPSGRWVARYHEVMMPQAAVATVADCGMANVYPAAHIARHDPARVLREVEAMRSVLLALHATGRPTTMSEQPSPTAGLARLALRHLAAVWSDHRQYQPEWALTS